MNKILKKLIGAGEVFEHTMPVRDQKRYFILHTRVNGAHEKYYGLTEKEVVKLALKVLMRGK